MVEFLGQVALYRTIIMTLSSTLQKAFSVKSRLASIAGSGQCPQSSLFTSFVENPHKFF
jgi:hypothetical protein